MKSESRNEARPKNPQRQFPGEIDPGAEQIHDIQGYSGEDAERRMRQRRDNPHHGHPTGAYTDIGEGRSGVTEPKKNIGSDTKNGKV